MCDLNVKPRCIAPWIENEVHTFTIHSVPETEPLSSEATVACCSTHQQPPTVWDYMGLYMEFF